MLCIFQIFSSFLWWRAPYSDLYISLKKKEQIHIAVNNSLFKYYIKQQHNTTWVIIIINAHVLKVGRFPWLQMYNMTKSFLNAIEDLWLIHVLSIKANTAASKSLRKNDVPKVHQCLLPGDNVEQNTGFQNSRSVGTYVPFFVFLYCWLNTWQDISRKKKFQESQIETTTVQDT